MASPWTCDTCQRQLATKKSLSRHQKIHQRISIWFCDDCHRTFKQEQDKHQCVGQNSLIHKYQCTHCDDVFDTARNHDAHHCHAEARKDEPQDESHDEPQDELDSKDESPDESHDEPDYKGESHDEPEAEPKDEPEAEPKDDPEYKDEPEAEPKDEPHDDPDYKTCEICQKKFQSNQSCTHHKKTHQRITIWTCHYCHQVSKTPASKHQCKSGRWVKAYQCTICDRQFKLAAEFNRHQCSAKQQTPNAPLTICPLCPAFYSIEELALHIADYHKATHPFVKFANVEWFAPGEGKWTEDRKKQFNKTLAFGQANASATSNATQEHDDDDDSTVTNIEVDDKDDDDTAQEPNDMEDASATHASATPASATHASATPAPATCTTQDSDSLSTSFIEEELPDPQTAFTSILTQVTEEKIPDATQATNKRKNMRPPSTPPTKRGKLETSNNSAWHRPTTTSYPMPPQGYLMPPPGYSYARYPSWWNPSSVPPPPQGYPVPPYGYSYARNMPWWNPSSVPPPQQ